ncbi:NAD(P)-binding domain-containing protein [Kribbella albertanoniae]|uniref:NAD(P)-dependent oxidoreductase n=1 Tax=Kribbella albertanoniae TaxID=1266829 RepID=A0A4R4QEE6_9ACTN|nr:NAD(P)-binding domain-containing protein [Kribbella albertanoniae]TDC33820.1 NAD(P)-dependent oxidoreductase [Kribbella albertanoniae]
MKTPVTVLGLGAMGTALAQAFLAAGHPTTVWNRTPGRSPELEGAIRATTAAEAVAASPLVVVCLLVDTTVRDTLDGIDLTGKVIANLTNSTPDQARALETTLTAQGATYVDGGIMAVPAMIGRPEAFILYSGDSAAFERHQADLAVLARPLFVGSDAGLAALHDIALLSAMYGMFGGAQHALALMHSAKVPTVEFTEQLLLPWLTAMLGMLPQIAAELEQPPVGQAAGSNLAMQAAAYHNLLDTAVGQGIDPMLLRPMGELLQKAVASGHGDEDMAAMIRLLG